MRLKWKAFFVSQKPFENWPLVDMCRFDCLGNILLTCATLFLDSINYYAVAMIQSLTVFVKKGSYPAHFGNEKEFERNMQVIRCGLNALKDSSCIRIESLERQIEKLESERAKDQESFDKSVLKLHSDFNDREAALIEQGKLSVLHELYKLQCANAALVKEQEQSKEREHYLVEKAKQDTYKEMQECVRKCDQLKSIKDNLVNQVNTIVAERQNSTNLLNQQINDLKENHQLQLQSLDRSIYDLNLRLQDAFNLQQEKWEAGVEYGKRIQSQLDQGKQGEEWVKDHILKCFPGCNLVQVSKNAHQADFHLTIEGVKILIEVKNTKTYCASQYQKFLRDFDECASGTHPVHAGLYVNLHDTKRARVWHIEKVGNLPHALLDHACAHPKLIELGIRTLVYMVHQVRESSNQLSDCDKKLKTLQDNLHILVEGTLTKGVKELISSAEKTLTQARNLEDVFIHKFLH